jgi:spore coat polysaccharide biosynthesis protein SpsF
MLAIMIQRVMAAHLVDTVVVATPEGNENEPLWEFVQKAPPVKLVRGSEDDVLGRVLKAARDTKTDMIVELTGDCPLIDPWIIDLCIGYAVCGDWDIVGNVKPTTWPKGMDVRVFRTETLERVDREVRGDAREAYWREHVSPFMYSRPESTYRCKNIEAPDDERVPDLNLSVDTPEDFRRVKDIVESLRPGNAMFMVKDILTYLARLPGYEHLSGPSQIERVAGWLS